MRITSIKKRGNDAEIIYNDTSKIVLDYKIVFDNGLRKNDEITEDRIDELILQNEKLKVQDSAFRFLGRRLHSRSELYQKLIKKGFKKSIVSDVLSGLEEKKIINDFDFARLYSEEKVNKKKTGINKIKAGLIQKGVDRKIIEHVLSQLDSSTSEDIAFELAKKKMDNLRRGGKMLNTRQKLYSFLFSKGFENDVILKVLQKLKIEDNFSDLLG